MRAEVDLLEIERGTVTAPAGCGKTQLIAAALAGHENRKPVLILTHTNAGVVALRARLDKVKVPAKAYRLSTIDGWAMRLISMFPGRSGHDPGITKLVNPRVDYPGIRIAAANLLERRHVDDVMRASYARVVVDEYQDCSVRQHRIVSLLANSVPVCVLGDPMQAIFGFGGDRLASWDGDVCEVFRPAGQLSTPWRWINSNSEELGRWLLEARKKLQRGECVDLRSAPAAVRWVRLDGANDHKQRLAAARIKAPGESSTVLIIGDSVSPESQRQIASQTPGAITVEAVDLKDLIRFAQTLDLKSNDALRTVAEFAESVMTNVGSAELIRRVDALRRGAARKPPSHVERAAVTFMQEPSYGRAVELLVGIGKQSGVRTHRPAVLRACIRALNECGGVDQDGFYNAAIRIREQNRLVGRSLPRRAVGSTLLLKGLEADVAVVLNAEAMDARNLYVAITRGSKMLVVCSGKPTLNPR